MNVPCCQCQYSVQYGASRKIKKKNHKKNNLHGSEMNKSGAFELAP